MSFKQYNIDKTDIQQIPCKRLNPPFLIKKYMYIILPFFCFIF